MRKRGTVKWFNEAKGFGFIQQAGGEDEQDLSELPFEMRTVEKEEPDVYTLAIRVKGKPAPSRSFNPLTGEGGDKKPEPPGDPAFPVDEFTAVVGGDRAVPGRLSVEGSVIPDPERGVAEPLSSGEVAAGVGKVAQHEPPGERPI